MLQSAIEQKEPSAILMSIFLPQFVAPRDIGYFTIREPPACLCAALEPFQGLPHAYMPCQEAYSTVGDIVIYFSFLAVTSIYSTYLTNVY